MRGLHRTAVFTLTIGAALAFAQSAAAHFVGFKSPGPGMHFTQGQPIVIFADIFDSREGKGLIICPSGQSISNQSPPPAYSDPGRPATCSAGGTPTGWPQFQVLIDGVEQTDVDRNQQTIPNTTSFNHDLNPDPIGFFRFKAPSAGLAAGAHRIVVRGLFSADGTNVTQLDSAPLEIVIDAPPAKSTVTLSSDFLGPVSWNDVIVVGNGHAVKASGSLVIRDSLITGIAGISGSVSDAAIEGSIFEDSGPLDLVLGAGPVSIQNDEFRANNRLTFVASDPSVPFIVTFRGGGAGTKRFQGNRVGAGQMSFAGDNWLIGGDSEQQSNVFIGPRTVLNISGSKAVIRGNFSHHNYRGAWSQGFNFYYDRAGADVLTEHNFIRDSSWPVQNVTGEFRYNVVYGYGHTWVRSAAAGASIHHNVFAPGGDGGLNSGIQCYGGESGLLIYNNTFDGGGAALGDFAGPTIDMSGGSQVVSFRNNLVTFSRDMENGNPGAERVTGGSGAYKSADYNAFYAPDNANKRNYDFSGAGAHDVADTSDGQLAGTPFAGPRITSDADRNIASVIDEGAVWQGTQKVAEVLALFRARYMPRAGSPVIDSGDPQDTDAQGRRIDIGAIDLDGHDLDKLGKFGMSAAGMVAGANGGAGAGGMSMSANGGTSGGAGGAGAGGGVNNAGNSGGVRAGVDAGTPSGTAGAARAGASGTSAVDAPELRSGCSCSSVNATADTRGSTMLAMLTACALGWRQSRRARHRLAA
jgi:hypothetical protein